MKSKEFEKLSPKSKQLAAKRLQPPLAYFLL